MRSAARARATGGRERLLAPKDVQMMAEKQSLTSANNDLQGFT
jgi:hypothetical protein